MDTSNLSFTRALKFLSGLFLWLPVADSSAEEFTIVVLPDTQFYSESAPAIFQAQTNWIRTNPNGENIIYAAHLGDIVDSFGCNGGVTEWANARTAMDDLHGAVPADDIPYGVMPGNHDWDPLPGTSTCSTDRDQYNDNFGPTDFGSYYGGNFLNDTVAGDPNETNDDNYTLFSSPGGIGFIAINLAFANLPGSTESDILDWADDLLKNNPDRLGIVTSHYILNESSAGGSCGTADDFGPYGQLIWDSLRDNPNLIMVLSGHCRGEKWLTYTGGVGDRPGCLGDVHVLMSNYQSYNGQQSGYMRAIRFDTVARTIDVETFSPTLPGGGVAVTIANPVLMSTTSVSNFSLDYNAFVGHCADVSLVMDVSGSMNADSAAIAGSKLDALQGAADLFAAQVALDGDHRLAMTQFNHGVPAFTVPEIPFTPLDSGDVPAAQAVIGSMSAGGATDIVGGLDAGIAKINVPSPNERRVAVLFTDGRHNTPMALPPATLAANLEAEINAVDSDIQLYSIGFGNSVSDAALITAAGNKNGWHVNETDPIVMAKNFSLVAARAMDNQVLTDPIYLLKPGETRAHGIGVSRFDTNLTIAVHWDRFDPDTIKTRVTPPGGTACAFDSATSLPTVQQVSGANYRLIRVNLPFACAGGTVHEGEWKVEMTAARGDFKAERVDILAYADSAIKLGAQVALDGDKFRISAKLEGESLKDSTFTAYLLPPIPDTGDSTDLDSQGSDPDTIGSLPAQGVVKRTPIDVPLKVTGRTADSIEAIGTYGPRLYGAYQVRVVADLIDGNAQSLQREALASVFNHQRKSIFVKYWVYILAFVIVLVLLFAALRQSGKVKPGQPVGP